MVCLGNICRSPIAEGVMKSKLEKYTISGYVDSAGVLSVHSGENPDYRASLVAKKYGIDITSQRARQIRKSDFTQFDLILTMDFSVHEQISKITSDPEHLNKIKLFMEYAEATKAIEVPDPYYGGPEEFEAVFSMIDDACEKIAKKIS